MTDLFYMEQALREARKAYDAGEVPVGALIVQNDRILGRGYNQVEKLVDPTAHAEIIALTAACQTVGGKYLPEATLYVTLEPCLMCAGALYWARLGRIVWGADDPKNGHRRTTAGNWPFHPKTQIHSGVLQEECAALMRAFFQARR